MKVSSKIGSFPSYHILLIVIGAVSIGSVYAVVTTFTDSVIIDKTGGTGGLTIKASGGAPFLELTDTDTSKTYKFRIRDGTNKMEIMYGAVPKVTLKPAATGFGVGFPTERVDVAGNVKLSGSVICTNCVDSTDIADGTVGTADIAAGVVTAPKVASSFMKFGQLLDDATGNAAGWNPDDIVSAFLIEDSAVKSNSIIDTTVDNGKILSVIPTSFSSPYHAAFNPTTNKVYATSFPGGKIAVIDTNTRTLLTEIDTGDCPLGVGVNPVTNKVYVSEHCTGMLFVIDGATDSLTDTLDLGFGSPREVGVNPVTNRIYVANESGGLSVINGADNTLITEIVVDSPQGVAVNTLTNRIYTSNFVNTVSVINGADNTVITTINVGNHPRGIAVNEVTNRIYVANADDDTVSVINGGTNTVIATVAVGDEPSGSNGDVTVNSNTNKIYVPNITGQSVSVINGADNTVLTTITGVGGFPSAIDVDPSSNLVYVSRDGGIGMIDGSTDTLLGIPAPVSCFVYDLIVNTSFRLACDGALSDEAILNYAITTP